MARRVDVVVVGAGVHGLAAARALARAGRSVIVLEQFELGHTRGSSHGTSRIFRFAYEDPAFVAMAKAAVPLWRELEEECGARLLQATGALDVGGDLERMQRALASNGVAAELLDGDELRRRFPRLRLPDREALFQAEGGIVRADRTHAALVRSVRGHGAGIHPGTAVTAIEPKNGQVRVSAGAEEISAGAAVIAAGPWGPRLLAPLGIDLPVTVTRETVAHYRLSSPNGLPTVIDRTPSSTGDVREAYGLASPTIGLKVGINRSGQATDPDAGGVPDALVIASVEAWARERYELADQEPALVETCLYTTTDDERFVLERHGRVVVCSACSGHGFKFTPETGRRTAELAQDALAL